MSRSSSESEELGPSEEEHGFLERLHEIPIVKSAVLQASSMYTRAKEANAMTKISLSFAEMSIKSALESTKYAYNVVPSTRIGGTLREEAEKKVGQVGAIACSGLDLVIEKYPAIMTEPQEIISAGADKLEKSEVIEAVLIVSEAAADYINPTEIKKIIDENVEPKVVSNKKFDRMIDITRRTGTGLYRGGSKMFWNTAATPWYVTKSGFNMACRAAAGTANMTRNVMLYIPGLSRLVTPPTKFRRSYRRRMMEKKPTSGQPPSLVSPDKKRKRSNGESNSDEDDTLYEMVYVKEYYEDDKDPDYSPKDQESEDDSDEDSSTTVGASGEEGDSGEGDEVDACDMKPVGGQTHTAGQVKRSVRFQGEEIVHQTQPSLLLHVTENKKSTEVRVVEKEVKEASQKSGIPRVTTKDGATIAGENIHGTKASLIVHVTEKQPTEVHVLDKDVKEASQKLEIQKGQAKDGAGLPEKAKRDEKTTTDKVKDYPTASSSGKETVIKSANDKTASADCATKTDEKTKSTKGSSTKPQLSNMEGAKNGQFRNRFGF